MPTKQQRAHVQTPEQRERERARTENSNRLRDAVHALRRATTEIDAAYGLIRAVASSMGAVPAVAAERPLLRFLERQAERLYLAAEEIGGDSEVTDNVVALLQYLRSMVSQGHFDGGPGLENYDRAQARLRLVNAGLDRDFIPRALAHRKPEHDRSEHFDGIIAATDAELHDWFALSGYVFASEGAK